jgi:hypothetical protein
MLFVNHFFRMNFASNGQKLWKKQNDTKTKEMKQIVATISNARNFGKKSIFKSSNFIFKARKIHIYSTLSFFAVYLKQGFILVLLA